MPFHIGSLLLSVLCIIHMVKRASMHGSMKYYERSNLDINLILWNTIWKRVLKCIWSKMWTHPLPAPQTWPIEPIIPSQTSPTHLIIPVTDVTDIPYPPLTDGTGTSCPIGTDVTDTLTRPVIKCELESQSEFLLFSLILRHRVRDRPK
jgi:hypothetical protein